MNKSNENNSSGQEKLYKDSIAQNEFNLKPISLMDSPEVKMIKYNWELQDFILNSLFKK